MELEQKKSCKDFVLVYMDKDTGERTVRTFESRSKRDKEIKTRNEGELTFCPPMMVKGVLH